MALNIKAAMLICMAAVGAVSWTVRQIGLPQVAVDSPLVLGDVRTELAQAAGVHVAQVETRPDRRLEWARQFTRPNALDTQAEVNRTTTGTLALQPPAEPWSGTSALIELPPLAYEAETALAAADERESGLVVEGGAVVVAADGEAGREAAGVSPAEPKRYRVAKGDTLSKIALREWKSRDPRLVRLLTEMNPKAVRGVHVRIGDELLIPDLATAQRYLAGERPAGVATLASAEGNPQTTDAEWYTIRKSDTLCSIARRFLKDGRRWREIVALNRALDPHKIVPGTRIKLPRALRLAAR